MLLVDTIINVCYGVTVGNYIYLYIGGFWQSSVEIANFYILIWAYLARIAMMVYNCETMWDHNKRLEALRDDDYK